MGFFSLVVNWYRSKKIFYFHRINLLSQGYKMDAYEKYIMVLMWKVHHYQSPLYCSIIYKKASDSKSNYKLGQCVNLFEMFYY